MINFLKKVAWYFEESQRQTGRTTILIEKAKENGDILVCHGADLAYRLRRDYNVNAITLDQYLDPDYHRGKVNVKYLFDSPAEMQIIQKKLDEAERLLSGKVLNYEN